MRGWILTAEVRAESRCGNGGKRMGDESADGSGDGGDWTVYFVLLCSTLGYRVYASDSPPSPTATGAAESWDCRPMAGAKEGGGGIEQGGEENNGELVEGGGIGEGRARGRWF